VTSSAAILTVNYIKITTQPTNQAVPVGSTATFTVSATANPSALTYQWQRSTDGGTTWANCASGTGAKTASYTTIALYSASNGYQYRVLIANAAGSQTSNAGTATVFTPRTLTGTRINTYVTTSGTTNVPIDLSSLVIAAWVPDGNGGYTHYAGTGKADGTFSIPGLPPGNCLVQCGTNYVWTSANALDLGMSTAGRANQAFPTLSTYTNFNATGMTPWAGSRARRSIS